MGFVSALRAAGLGAETHAGGPVCGEGGLPAQLIARALAREDEVCLLYTSGSWQVGSGWQRWKFMEIVQFSLTFFGLIVTILL